MAPRRWTSPIVSPVSPERHHGSRDRVASYVRRVAERRGMKPTTLHALIHGRQPVPELLAEVITEAIAEGKRDSVAAHFQVIEAAFHRLNQPLTKALLLQAYIADKDEDEAFLAFALSGGTHLRKQLKRHIAIERTAKLELWQAL